MTNDIIVDTGKSKITLDELGSIQPGMARLMAEIAQRIGTCYHAARAENWGMARYMLTEAVKTMQAAMLTRPKYADNMTTFITEQCDAVLGAIEKQDPEAFYTAFDAMADAANAYHELYDKPYIRWRAPATGPEHLDLKHTG
jgi:hypothetical protein